MTGRARASAGVIGGMSAALLLLACGSGSGDGPVSGETEADAGSEPAADGTGGSDGAAGDDATTEAPALPEVWGPQPAVDLNPDPGILEVELTAEVWETFLLDVPVSLYGYDGGFPGPLLQARKGDRLIVHFENLLPEPTTIHWHGLRIPEEMDGTPRVMDPVEPGETFTYDFVLPDAGSFWYHPHIAANEQVEQGLYGPIVVRDDLDPEYDLERYLVLDDILLDFDASGLPPFLSGHMEEMHGRLGNVLLINGSTEVLETAAEEGQVERWRIVNTANARTMEVGVTGASFRVVGTDGGLLPEPYVTDRVVIPVGARYDLEVSYDAPGTVELVQYVLTLDEQDQVVEAAFPTFRVEVAATGVAPPAVPWPDFEIPFRPFDLHGTMVLDGVMGPGMSVTWTINGKADPEEPLFTEPVGTVLRLLIDNQGGPEHPFHLHGQFFRIVGRNGEGVDEPGLRDTVLVPGEETVQLDLWLDNPGMWMAHCHILEHAELGMMSHIMVVPAEGDGDGGGMEH